MAGPSAEAIAGATAPAPAASPARAAAFAAGESSGRSAALEAAWGGACGAAAPGCCLAVVLPSGIHFRACSDFAVSMKLSALTTGKEGQGEPPRQHNQL